MVAYHDRSSLCVFKIHSATNVAIEKKIGLPFFEWYPEERMISFADSKRILLTHASLKKVFEVNLEDETCT